MKQAKRLISVLMVMVMLATNLSVSTLAEGTEESVIPTEEQVSVEVPAAEAQEEELPAEEPAEPAEIVDEVPGEAADPDTSAETVSNDIIIDSEGSITPDEELADALAEDEDIAIFEEENDDLADESLAAPVLGADEDASDEAGGADEGEKAQDYITGNGVISQFEIEGPGVQDTYSTISFTLSAAFSMKEGSEYSGFKNTTVHYRFLIPSNTASDGVLNFYNYGAIANSETTKQIEGQNYRVIEGVKTYEDAMPGAVTETFSVKLDQGRKGESYTIQGEIWLEADGEDSKETVTKEVTVESSLNGMYDLKQYGETAFSGYYDRDNKVYYDSAARAQSAGANVTFGRFYWISSYVGSLNNEKPGIESLSKDAEQTWKLQLSLEKSSSAEIVEETNKDLKPILIDSISLKADDQKVSTYGIFDGIDLTMDGHSIPQSGNVYRGYGISADFSSSQRQGQGIDVSGKPSLDTRNGLGIVSLVFVPMDIDDGDTATRRLKWEVSDLALTRAGGSTGGDTNLDNNTGSVVVPPKSNGGDISKRIYIGYQELQAASVGVGRYFRVNPEVNYSDTVSDAEINAVDLFTKWDADGCQITINDEPGLNTNAYNNYTGGYYNKNYSGSNQQIRTYFVAKADGTNWSSTAEMLSTHADNSNLLFYENYADLGDRKCIGVLNEYRGGMVTGSKLGWYYQPFKAIGVPGGDYVLSVDYAHWSGSNILSADDVKGHYSSEPSYTDYADFDTIDKKYKTYYKVDIWDNDGIGRTDDERWKRDAVSIHELGYQLSREQSSNALQATVLNSDKGSIVTKRDTPAIFDVSAGHRTVAVKSQFAILWPSGEDPREHDIYMEFEPEGTRMGQRILADDKVWENIHDGGTAYLASADAEVTWDPESMTFKSSSDLIPLTKNGERYEFSVRGSGIYCIYHTYTLGDAEDVTKDVESKVYALGTNFYVQNQSKGVCYANGMTTDYTTPTVEVTRTGVIGLTKSATDPVVGPQGQIEYSISSTNESSTTQIVMLDVLPFNGDGRGSKIPETYHLTENGAEVNISSAAATPESQLALYYTVSKEVRSAGESGGLPLASNIGTFNADNSLGVSWKHISELTSEESPTAIVLAGSFAKGERFNVKVRIQPDQLNQESVYANNATIVFAEFGENNIASNVSKVEVVSKQISGIAWDDQNGDGYRGEDESALAGITVRLYQADKTQVTKNAYGNDYGTVTTDANGYYHFDNPVDSSDGWYVEYELNNAQAEKYALSVYRNEGENDSDFEESSNMTGKTPVFTLPSYDDQAKQNIPVRASMVRDMGFGPRITVDVKKDWETRFNMKSAVTVSLFADNSATGETLTLNDSNEWKGSFEKLRKYSVTDGHEIGYTVDEADLDGFTKEIDNESETKIITNTMKSMDSGSATLQIKKVREGDESVVVPGAVFALSDGTTKTTDENGIATFTFNFTNEAEKASLTLSEQSAPAGYTKTDKVWTVGFTRDETPTVTLDKDEDLFKVVWDWKISVTENNQDSSGQDGGDQESGGKDSRYVNGMLTVANTYKAEDQIVLQGTKTLTGRDMVDDEFTFTVKDEKGEAVATGKSKEAKSGVPGNIVFEPIPYTYKDEGTHTYTITEDEGELGGVTYDESRFTVEVEVKDNKDGTLTVSPTYPTDGVKFENSYAATGSVKLEAGKTLTGRKLNDGEFSFAVTEGDKTAATGKNDAEGKIVFSKIDYTLEDVGTHTYTITENEGELGGVTYDKQSFEVKTVVSDNGDGTLNVDTVYPKDGTVFENKYDTAPVTLTLGGKKELAGRDLAEGEFAFTVKEGEKVVATGKNSKDGKITFSDITYKLEDVGTHSLVITEEAGEKGGVEYSKESYTVTVTVTDNGDGTLALTAGESANGIVFHNAYTAAECAVTITSKKVYTGAKLKGGDFSFELKDSTGKTVEIVKNDASGVIAFSSLHFTKPGEYRYTIGEIEGTDSHVTYDDTVYTAVITVTDDGEGKLLANTKFSAESLVFTNKYTSDKSDSKDTTDSSGNKNASGSSSTTTTGPKTGDDSNVAQWLIMLICSAFALAVLLGSRKRYAGKHMNK